MKRILSSAMILILLLCCATPCFAAEGATLTNEKLTATKEVAAKYIRIYEERDGYTFVEDEDGDGVYTATTDSGLTVMVVSDQEGFTLVVHEVTEADKEAAIWFKKQFSGAKNIAPLEIFFINKDGHRYDLPADTQITLEGLKDNQYVILLSSGGRKDRVSEAVKNGAITLKATDASDYYVVVTPETNAGGSVEDDQQQGGKPQKPAGEPDTGDQSHLWIWISLMAVSAAGIILADRKLKKMKA